MASALTVPWTPRSGGSESKGAEEQEQDDLTLMQVIVEALVGFPDAKRAVVEALTRVTEPFVEVRRDYS